LAKTKIADIVVPEVFNPYVIERTAELSALWQSGIVRRTPELDSLASSGGTIIKMPYWEDLTGADQVLSDSDALEVNKITAGQDKAVLLMRGNAWSVNDLAKALSGDDPMRAIGDLVAAYWARRWQAVLLSTLSGVFGATSMATNLHNISAATKKGIDATTTLDALQKLGDAKDRLVAFAMHSATETFLAKNNLIEYIRESDANPRVPTYLGKRVIVDDGLPAADGVYTTYIFGEGAFGLGEGAAPVPTEFDRDSLAGDDIMINRRHFILHPRGVAWQNPSIDGSSPTNGELATSANWRRVYDPKNVRIVAFKHKLEANS
jgi:hypothetical protein